MVRRLEDVLADQARAAADDRDLSSRSDARRARKHAERAASKLAEALVKLSVRQLERLELGEPLLDAVLEARRIESPVARIRALRAVRRELRAEELATVEAALRRLYEPRRPFQNAANQWRERLLGGGEQAIDEFCSRHPSADRRRLRTLLRNVERAPAGARSKAVDALGVALGEAIEQNEAV